MIIIDKVIFLSLKTKTQFVKKGDKVQQFHVLPSVSVENRSWCNPGQNIFTLGIKF